ncbi:hypothetical protein CLF_107109 [Clonorchis sinensis]|uniref:Uncharacterized protein n=1 Tax=Clonorchis sinensis TaxID=79923 RepID=G7YQG0_CLOSI|nr:hypothetical protein CLF_107109 [Clonorchis sinensis]
MLVADHKAPMIHNMLIQRSTTVPTSIQVAFDVLRMIRRTFSRITRTDFQIIYGAYVRPLLEYASPVLYSGRTKDVILIELVQRAATKMVAGLKSMDYETRFAVLDLFPLEYRRLGGDLILTYALFEQGLANRFFTVDPANTRRGHGEHLLNDKNKTDPGNLGESLAPVYQSVNPLQSSTTPRLDALYAVIHSTWPVIHIPRDPQADQKNTPDLTLNSSYLREFPWPTQKPRCSQNCMSHPKHIKRNVRYGAVQKPNYGSTMMARHCHTQFDSTLATNPFLFLTVPSRPLGPLPATTNKLMLDSKCNLMITPARSCYPQVVNKHYYYLTIPPAMYPPPRPWDRDSPRRYGPPGRFPRRRSRSPIPPMPDRYPYPEPPAGPPFRNAPAASPYPRGPRSNEPFPSRARPDEFAYERSVPYREPEMGDYYEPPRRGPERPMDSFNSQTHCVRLPGSICPLRISLSLFNWIMVLRQQSINVEPRCHAVGDDDSIRSQSTPQNWALWLPAEQPMLPKEHIWTHEGWPAVGNGKRVCAMSPKEGEIDLGSIDLESYKEEYADGYFGLATLVTVVIVSSALPAPLRSGYPRMHRLRPVIRNTANGIGFAAMCHILDEESHYKEVSIEIAEAHRREKLTVHVVRGMAYILPAIFNEPCIFSSQKLSLQCSSYVS